MNPFFNPAHFNLNLLRAGSLPTTHLSQLHPSLALQQRLNAEFNNSFADLAKFAKISPSGLPTSNASHQQQQPPPPLSLPVTSQTSPSSKNSKNFSKSAFSFVNNSSDNNDNYHENQTTRPGPKSGNRYSSNNKESKYLSNSHHRDKESSSKVSNNQYSSSSSTSSNHHGKSGKNNSNDSKNNNANSKPELNPACLPRCNCEELMKIDAKLETKELWEKFHELGTEMIITKTGRR